MGCLFTDLENVVLLEKKWWPTLWPRHIRRTLPILSADLQIFPMIWKLMTAFESLTATSPSQPWRFGHNLFRSLILSLCLFVIIPIWSASILLASGSIIPAGEPELGFVKASTTLGAGIYPPPRAPFIVVGFMNPKNVFLVWNDGLWSWMYPSDVSFNH